MAELIYRFRDGRRVRTQGKAPTPQAYVTYQGNRHIVMATQTTWDGNKEAVLVDLGLPEPQ